MVPGRLKETPMNKPTTAMLALSAVAALALGACTKHDAPAAESSAAASRTHSRPRRAS